MTDRQASITLRHLLTMTSGISGDHPSEDAVSHILGYGTSNDPGVTFEYSNGNAHLVAAVLQEAVDRPLLDYARERLFDPLKIDTRPAWQGADWDLVQTGFTQPGFGWARDREGINVGGFGLKLTAPDLVKIGELSVNGGRWDGRQIGRRRGLGSEPTEIDSRTGGGRRQPIWLHAGAGRIRWTCRFPCLRGVLPGNLLYSDSSSCRGGDRGLRKQSRYARQDG